MLQITEMDKALAVNMPAVQKLDFLHHESFAGQFRQFVYVEGCLRECPAGTADVSVDSDLSTVGQSPSCCGKLSPLSASMRSRCVLISRIENNRNRVMNHDAISDVVVIAYNRLAPPTSVREKALRPGTSPWRRAVTPARIGSSQSCFRRHEADGSIRNEL